jgi:hypothetical protein
MEVLLLKFKLLQELDVEHTTALGALKFAATVTHVTSMCARVHSTPTKV